MPTLLIGRPSAARLVAVDLDRVLRIVDVEILGQEDEQAGLLRLLQEGAGDVVQLVEATGGADGELNRQPAGAGKRRDWKATVWPPAILLRSFCTSG